MQGTGTQDALTHVSSVAVETIHAVSPDVFDVHAGNVDVVCVTISTEYTPLLGGGAAATDEAAPESPELSQPALPTSAMPHPAVIPRNDIEARLPIVRLAMVQCSE
ncbi:MAG: hypothetical protein ACLQVI_13330 [Polyangiaceae bacterium]